MYKKDRIGRTAYIFYKGGAKGEEILDDRSTGEPLKVLLGENAVPKGIEAAIYDMEIGECRDIEIAPEDAYGYPSPDGIQWYPRNMVKDGYKLQKGDVIALGNKYEQEDVLPGRITEATDDMLQVDANHPYAGKTLAYWINLVELV